MKSANQILAENLRRVMGEKGLNNLTLGKAAKVAPNTIKNYLSFSANAEPTASGKERSAKLTEIERLARALKVSLVDLLTEHESGKEIAPVLSEVHQQLLFNLDYLPQRKQSAIIDQVRQAADEAREVEEHLESKKRGTVSMAAVKPRKVESLVLTYGDNNPLQGVLPLSTVSDPFTAEPGERESALYVQIGKTPR